MWWADPATAAIETNRNRRSCAAQSLMQVTNQDLTQAKSASAPNQTQAQKLAQGYNLAT